MERSKVGTQYRSPEGLAIARVNIPPESHLDETVDELPNPTPIIHPLPPGRFNVRTCFFLLQQMILINDFVLAFLISQLL